MKKNILCLPNEILTKIFSYLDIINQYNFSNSCTRLFYLYYGNKIKHEKFLYKCKTNEWKDFISFIKKRIKYRIVSKNEVGDEYILIIISTDYVICYDLYKKENYKYTNIHDLIYHINIHSHKYLVFITHKIKLQPELNYNTFKKI